MSNFRIDRFKWEDDDLQPVTSEREGDEMANPLEETPELEAELDDLEAELGDSVEPEAEQPASKPIEDQP